MRSEAWRPAAAARNRSSREARDPARQALRPGCEVLAVRTPEAMPETEARVRSQKPPRWSAERRASRVWDARRLARRLACRVWHAQRVLRRAPQRLSALRLPLFWGERSKRCKTPGAEMRRGNEEVLLDASTRRTRAQAKRADNGALRWSSAKRMLGWAYGACATTTNAGAASAAAGTLIECGARAAPQGWTWLHHVLKGLREGRSQPEAMEAAESRDAGLSPTSVSWKVKGWEPVEFVQLHDGSWEHADVALSMNEFLQLAESAWLRTGGRRGRARKV